MPAPVINAMRTAKAHGVGPFADQQDQNSSYDMTSAYLRHKEGGAMHAAEAVSGELGEGMFGKAFMLGAGGWVGTKTLGHFKPNVIPKIGKIAYAPVHALDSLSFKDFNLNNLKANYYHHVGEYVTKHGAKKGLDASPWHAKANALGGANIAKAEWKGLKNIAPYLKGRAIFSTVMMGGLALGGALAFFRSGKHAKDGLDDLIEVARDLDGKDYSRYDMINHPEKLSPEMNEIRANLKAHLIPDVVGAAGKSVGNAAFAAMGGPAAHAAAGMMGGMGSMGGMMAGMMLEQSADAFKPSLDFVQSYLLVKDMQADGTPPPPEVYATLLASASPEVRRMGGTDVGMVQRLAMQYAEANISPRNMVHEIFSGAPFEARMANVAQEIQAEQQTEEGATVEETPEAKESKLPDAANLNGKPKVANINSTPAKVALSNVAHEGKMQAERTAQLGGRV